MTTTTPRLADQLVERIQALIADQQLDGGMRLPSERQLAIILGVSRNSVREAIQILIREGTLVSRRGGGTFVRYQLEPWSEQRIVQPIKTLLADDPGYRLSLIHI